MIGRERLKRAFTAFSEAPDDRWACRIAGVDPDELHDFAHDATERLTFRPTTAADGLAGVLAAGILLGITAARQREVE